MSKETLEAKLRNQLSPLYGLADLVLLGYDNPEIKPILIREAKKALKNRKKISKKNRDGVYP